MIHRLSFPSTEYDIKSVCPPSTTFLHFFSHHATTVEYGIMHTMKKMFGFIAGLIVFVALIVYQWLPFFGALSVIGGVIGLFTGSDIALRSIGVGVALIAVRYVISRVFVHMLEKGSSGKTSQDLSYLHSKLPVEVTEEDIEKAEKAELEYLARHQNDPSYNFPEDDQKG